jgi:hypothetical protein
MFKLLRNYRNLGGIDSSIKFLFGLRGIQASPIQFREMDDSRIFLLVLCFELHAPECSSGPWANGQEVNLLLTNVS